MSSRLKDMALEDLYNRPKITKQTLEAIQIKEDFSSIQPKYCDAACLLPCNNRETVKVQNFKADVVILQSHSAIPDRWKESWKIEKTNQGIIRHLANKHFSSGIRHRVVNTLKCDVDKSNLKGKAALTQTQVLRCSPYALHEIKHSGARVVISTTTEATKALGLSDKSNYNNRGEIHISPTLGIPVVITLHPKVTTMIRQTARGQMWGPDYFGVIDRDFAKAADLLSGKLRLKNLETAVAMAKKDIVVCKTLREVKKWCNHIANLPANTVISWDLETSSLDPWAEGAKILTTQYGFRDPDTGRVKAIVVPLWHVSNKFFNPTEAWEYNIGIIERGPMKVGHNIKFDIKYTAVTQGVRAGNVAFDTQLLLHDINSGVLGNYGLKRAVWDFLTESGLGGYEDLLDAEMQRIEEDRLEKEKAAKKEELLAKRRQKLLEKKQRELSV